VPGVGNGGSQEGWHALGDGFEGTLRNETVSCEEDTPSGGNLLSELTSAMKDVFLKQPTDKTFMKE
jgi:hypothetical protein